MMDLGVTDRYRSPDDLPRTVPVFPLTGCILLPRSSLPLNIFEPRYLAMINDAISESRVIGIIQPQANGGANESPTGKAYSLRQTGCAGRITSYTETDDGRILVTLTGIARFEVVSERQTAKPYRVCEITSAPFEDDFISGHGQDEVDWDKFLTILKSYLETRKLVADWQSIQRSPAEMLINTLSMISPYGPEEKQALLEAPDLKTRSEVLMALAEMDMAAPDNGGGSMH